MNIIEQVKYRANDTFIKYKDISTCMAMFVNLVLFVIIPIILVYIANKWIKLLKMNLSLFCVCEPSSPKTTRQMILRWSRSFFSLHIILMTKIMGDRPNWQWMDIDMRTTLFLFVASLALQCCIACLFGLDDDCVVPVSVLRKQCNVSYVSWSANLDYNFF